MLVSQCSLVVCVLSRTLMIQAGFRACAVLHVSLYFCVETRNENGHDITHGVCVCFDIQSRPVSIIRYPLTIHFLKLSLGELKIKIKFYQLIKIKN